MGVLGFQCSAAFGGFFFAGTCFWGEKAFCFRRGRLPPGRRVVRGNPKKWMGRAVIASMEPPRQLLMDYFTTTGWEDVVQSAAAANVIESHSSKCREALSGHTP